MSPKIQPISSFSTLKVKLEEKIRCEQHEQDISENSSYSTQAVNQRPSDQAVSWVLSQKAPCALLQPWHFLPIPVGQRKAGQKTFQEQPFENQFCILFSNELLFCIKFAKKITRHYFSLLALLMHPPSHPVTQLPASTRGVFVRPPWMLHGSVMPSLVSTIPL